MNNKDKIKILKEILDCESEITPETALSDLDEWDSVAILSFIAMMDDEFGKEVKGSVIRQFVTVQDALDCME
ncbi:MAG: acyl carrier protein [Lachnospiraceae bacterium]|jgi:acyl carrier protein|nr:acyl carrier protein [Lachnospiraceae bacterium]